MICRWMLKAGELLATARILSGKSNCVLSSESICVKTRSWLLTLLTAVSALALLAIPAEAGGKKKDRHQGWNNGGHMYC